MGAANVFQDVTTVAPGQDFQAHIASALAGSDAVLALIGAGWLTASTSQGEQRLFQPGDYVRMELAQALKTNLPVVPVLVGGSVLPTAEELPEDLRELSLRQAVVLRDEAFHQDLARLVRSLRGRPAASSPAMIRRRRIMVVTTVLAIVVAAGAGWWFVDGRGSGDESHSPTGCPDPVGADWHEVSLSTRRDITIPYAGTGSVTFAVNAAHWRPVEHMQWQVVVNTQMQNNTPDSHAHASYLYRDLLVDQRPFPISCFDPSPAAAAPTQIVDARAGFTVSCSPEGSMALVFDVSDNPDRTGTLPFSKVANALECTPSP